MQVFDGCLCSSRLHRLWFWPYINVHTARIAFGAMVMQSVSAHLAHAACVAMTYPGELLTTSSAWHAQDEEDKPQVSQR